MVAILTAIGFGILAMVAMIGVFHAALRATLGQAPSFSDLFNSQFTLQFVLVTLASMGLTFVGVLLCCLPGLLALFFLQLAPFYVLDSGPGCARRCCGAFGRSDRTSDRPCCSCC
jgi:uncharacterized membrane protein